MLEKSQACSCPVARTQQITSSSRATCVSACCTESTARPSYCSTVDALAVVACINSMPSYAPLQWHNSSTWKDRVSMDATDIMWQESSCMTSPWTTPGFPWDKHSIMDDRSIPWQVHPTSCGHSSRELDFAPLGAKPVSRISDLSVPLDPNHLVLHSAPKYQPLRESPTPPKAKKKCGKHRHCGAETQFNATVNIQTVRDLNYANLCSTSAGIDTVDSHLSSRLEGTQTTLGNKRPLDVRNCSYLNLAESCRTSCDPVPIKNLPDMFSRTSSRRPTIDRAAFERYYEGSVLGEHCASAATAAANRDQRSSEQQSVCGSLGPLSLALALPGKLEGLLKLLAQSLHLVLAGFCTRKARRKERESPATEQEHKLYLEEAVLERKIPETDLRQLVELPPGLGYHEWLASHTIDFFQHINLVYGTIAEFCTMSGCSDMSGPATRPYLWFDEKGKKVRVAAPQYIDYVMTFTQKTINDETIFPTKFENDFPVSFESIVKKIHRLLFHVIAHLYHSHFRELVLLSLHAHLNCIFAHFTLFNERFRLIDEKETEILHDLVLALRLHPEDRDHREPPGDNGTGIDNPVRPSSADSSLAVAGTSSSGRASPAAGAIPTTEGAPVEPQSAQTRLEDSSVAGIHSTAVTPTHTTTPFITPDVADTRP